MISKFRVRSRHMRLNRPINLQPIELELDLDPISALEVQFRAHERLLAMRDELREIHAMVVKAKG